MSAIVVVEDSPTQAQYIEALLTDMGFEVFVAYDGAEGLQLIDNVMPDAVVLECQSALDEWCTGLPPPQARS